MWRCAYSPILDAHPSPRIPQWKFMSSGVFLDFGWALFTSKRWTRLASNCYTESSQSERRPDLSAALHVELPDHLAECRTFFLVANCWFKPPEMLGICCHKMRFENLKCVKMRLRPGLCMPRAPLKQLAAILTESKKSMICTVFARSLHLSVHIDS